MVEELPEGYYLRNFHFLIDFVIQRYDDLLSDEEQSWAVQFKGMSEQAQRLYIRLITRRGPLFRLDKVNYSEVPDLSGAVSELLTQGFFISLTSREDVPLDMLLGLCTRPELLDWFGDLLPTDRPVSSLRKSDILDAIQAAGLDAAEYTRRTPFDVVTPSGREVLQVYQLLFFGNLHQDFTEFVLHELGITPFESYSLDRAARYFDHREIVDRTLASHELALLADIALGDNNEASVIELGEFLLTQVNQLEGAERRYSRVLNRVARQLERISEPDLAIQLYSKSCRVPSRERIARLQALQDPTLALQQCRVIAADPWDEAEMEFAHKFVTRLRKKLPETVNHELDWLRDMKISLPQVLVTVEANPSERVELLVCEHFSQQGFEACYVENGLLPGLFGLLFWDIIFAPVKGVFFNPYQRGPADIFTMDFVEARHELIEARFLTLREGGDYAQRILGVYESKQGTTNHFVMWGWLNRPLLEKALERLPPVHLGVIFKRMLQDLKNNRSGFPDLVVFSEDGYQLVEVKGPGDTIQDNQKRWFRCFQENDIPAILMNVEWQS